jgi:hypothetical protein
MLQPGFTYESCVAISERVAWKIADVLPPGAQLDFTKKFLPDSLVGASAIGFLSDDEKLKLNHIRGNSYAYLFGFVEEYIIAMTTKHATAEVFGDLDALRALLRFSEEEVKHQKLFQLFNKLFEEQLGHPPGFIGTPVAVAETILRNSPMGVLLITLHLELMTQCHWVEFVSRSAGVGSGSGGGGSDGELDPLFKSLLKNHWLEEAQHAKIDILELKKLADDASPDQIDRAIDEYIGILKALDGLLTQQARHDIETLSRALSRAFTDDERRQLLASQAASYRHVFIRLGISAPGFMDILEAFSPAGRARVAAHAALLD